MQRLSSGIPGLDEHIEGGFPVPSTVFIKGTAGTGKTTMVVQSLFHGAGKGEVGVYITGISEPVHLVKRFLSSFDFYQEAPIRDGRIQFWDLGETLARHGTGATVEALRQIIKAHGPRRVAIDPLPPAYYVQGVREYREFLMGLFNELRNHDIVTLVIGEKGEPGSSGVEDYMADGVISLDTMNLEDNPIVFKSVMRISKMRGTDHIRNLLSVGFTKKGMKIDRLA